MTRLAFLAFLCALMALSSGTGQERKTDPPAPVQPSVESKALRTHYVVKNGNPTALAEVVGKHFKGEATLLATPPGSGNAVLISGAPGTVPEVVKLLEQLDRKPRTVEVDVTFAEVPAKDWKESEAKADDLAKFGHRFKLTAVDGQLVSAQTGGSKPVVTSTPVAPGGFGKGAVQKSVAYQDIETTLKVTARVGSEDAVALELNLKDGRIRPAEAGDEVQAVSFGSSSLNTKVSIPAGKSVVVHSVRTEGKSGATVTVVLVTARVVPEASAKPR